ncbi:hypothetical protein L1049_012114 [Liquidambar formosana]|uniref:Mediator complex subunit 15 KIX domain-containing protein n=1 Tax=Liquidambar formosana TaxID=63359 RepID=A0AAP0RSG3_LIQFO
MKGMIIDALSVDTLKKHLPFSGQEGLQELKKIAVRFEENIYTAATNQSDYLRKISLKMLTMETKSQNTITNSLPSNSTGNGKNPSDPGSHSIQSQVHNQGQSIPIPMAANQSQALQQLLAQNITNNIAAAGAQSSAGLQSAMPSVTGLNQTSMPNVVNQNSTMQSISGVSQNSVGHSMVQGVPSNIFANQRQMQGRQQVVPQQQQQQQQQSQNQQFLYQQQFKKQKLQQGNIPHSLLQSHIQQQQQQQQQQSILQPNQLQSSQQSVMQTSSAMQPPVMQSAPLSGLQQSQQSSVQQSTQSMLQQHPQSVLRQSQQPRQASVMHQQQTPMTQQSLLSSQHQRQLMGQQPNATNMQQNQLIGQQNNIPDMQQQQQRLLIQQNNLPSLQQHQQLMGQQNNLSNIHQQQLGSQINVSGVQQQQQQQLLGNQSSNSGMQTNQHSLHMLQQSKVPVQQQNQQSASTLLPSQGQQPQPQPPQQQLMSQIQAQPAQLLQQLGLQQQPNSLQRDMQQRLQTSGALLQQQNVIDQQKQLFQSQRALPEASSTSLDSTAQTGHANGGDWQEEVYQKIKTMKEMYLPELNEMDQKIATKLQQHDSLLQQPKTEQLEKLKICKTMLERIISFLQVPKSNIAPSYKEKLGSYENQIINFLNTNRPR